MGKRGFVRRAEKRSRQCFKKEQLRRVGRVGRGMQTDFLKCERKSDFSGHLLFLSLTIHLSYFKGKIPNSFWGSLPFLYNSCGKQFDSFISKTLKLYYLTCDYEKLFWGIVDFQCVNFCSTAKWISYVCVYIHTHIHTHTFFFKIFSIMVYHRYLNIVLCGIR